MIEEKIEINNDETLDYFMGGRLKFIQKKKGYRFSLDSILLAGFVRRDIGGGLIEFGIGCGIISIILASRDTERHQKTDITHDYYIGLDIQGSMINLAERNVRLNGYESRINILHMDLRNVHEHFKPGQFSCVVCNPPFRAMGSGRLNPYNEKAIARHEMSGTIMDIIKNASYLLSNGGGFYIIYPVTRMADLIFNMRQHDMEPKRIRPVYPEEGGDANLILVEGRKGGGIELELIKPLVVYKVKGEYSEEVKKILMI